MYLAVWTDEFTLEDGDDIVSHMRPINGGAFRQTGEPVTSVVDREAAELRLKNSSQGFPYPSVESRGV
jgi:hypothetical protein